MAPNPVIGVVYHWLGGLASGSFYVPYRGVKRWAWETYWLAGGFFSWIIAPWVLGLLLTKDLPAVLSEAPKAALFWSFFFGLLWGVGGLTFGLTMRYLGLSLGMAVVLGLCAAFGTLMPPIFRGEFVSQVVGTTSGRVILFGIFVCLAGIAAASLAGISKDRVMSPEQQKTAIKEFNLKKGVGVAVLSGVMSACFAYGLAAGDPVKALTMKHGTPVLWQGLPVLVVVLIGGFVPVARSSSISRPPRRWAFNQRRCWSKICSHPKYASGNGSQCWQTICSARWLGLPGTSNSFSTQWVKPRWANTSSRVGHCIWRASSSLVLCGVSDLKNGKARELKPAACLS